MVRPMMLAAMLGAMLVASCLWARSPEYRVMWVSRFEWPSADEATAKANIDNIMQQVAANGFNAVLFQVRGQCDVHYPSPYEPWASTYGWTDPGWDPLAYAIASAHARGLEFHAYINTHTLSQGIPPANTTPQHPFNLHGPNVPLEQSWLIRDSSGATATSDNYYWISPGIPEASWWVRRAIMHVVENYDVDGVHFDRIRTPGPQFSYDPITVARFNGDGNPDGSSWGDFMRSQITRDLRNIYGEIQWKKKKVKVSAAPFGIVYKDATTNYQGSGTQSYYQWYQDSWGWMAAHCLDFIVPQIYWEVGSSHPFEALLADWQNHRAGRFVVAGSTTNGGSKTASALLAEYQQTVVQNAAGHCVFSVSTMGPYWGTFSSGPYATAAAVPDMPWKTSPTTGNIVGFVRDKQGMPVVDARVNRIGDGYNYLSAYDGFFAILEVPTSVPLTLTASKFGKGKATASGIVVGAGETTVVTLVLSKREGTVALDKPQYQFAEWAKIRLEDDDLVGVGHVEIAAVSSSEPAGETVRLDETTTPGVFMGTIQLVEGGAVAFDGRLSVAVGDTVAAVYLDADRGDGTSGMTSATASVVWPADIILESRTPSGALTPPPAYQEFITTAGTWANTTAKSAAPGLRAPGSRFTGANSLGAYAVWRPTVVSPGRYDVFITLANPTRGPNNDSPNAGFVVQHARGTVSGTFALSKNNPEITDQWMLLASDVSLSAGTGASLTIINNNPNSSSTQRFCMDAVKFVYRGAENASAGLLSFDRATYPEWGVARLRLVDGDLRGQTSATIQVASDTEPTSETIVLTEIGATGEFEGAVALALGEPVSGDGVIQVHDGDELRAAALDTNDGAGRAVWMSARAKIDARPPAIVDVQVLGVSASRATIRFRTDEPTTAVLRYAPGACSSPSPTFVRFDAPAEQFEVALTNLQSATTYRFAIVASDGVGHASLADNAGACYEFQTAAMRIGLDETFDGPPSDWSASGLWHLAGADDTCVSASSPPYCYHYARPDTCTYNTGGANKGSLVSPEFVVPPLGELTFASREQTESTSTLWDKRSVYLRRTTETTRTLLAALVGSGWTWTQAGPFDLSAFAGDAVVLEFEFDSVDGLLNDYQGWALDDVLVESADKLRVTSGCLEAFGNKGGPFWPPATDFVLRNGGARALDWISTRSVSWVSLSATSGTLGSDEAVTVTVVLNEEAALLPAGEHAATIGFANAATGLWHERRVAVTVADPPAPPTELRATAATQTSIALAWTDHADNETTFLLERDDGEGFAPLVELPADTTTFTDTELQAATTYRYRVAAANEWGRSAWSNTLVVRTLPWPPAAPTDLRAREVTQTRVALTWTDRADNESGFEVERDTGHGFELLATLPADTTSYEDSGLAAEAQVRYRVRAINEGGPSGWSNELEVRLLPWPPAAPTDLRATRVGQEIELVWVDRATNEEAYEVQGRSGNGDFVRLAQLGPNAQAWTHAGASPGQRHVYRVRALNAGGTSDWSNEVSLVVPAVWNFDDGPQGWILHGTPSPAVTGDWDVAHGALRLRVARAKEPRILGWQSPRLPLTGQPDTIYRFDAYVFRSGQSNMADPRQVPNMRLRCAVRYAMTSMQEMFWHSAVDPVSDRDMVANLPSADPRRPTRYRVDLDPVDVPAIDPVFAPAEGVQAMFEVYALEPQEQGSLELAEAVLSAVPAPGNVTVLKRYTPTATDAGDLRRSLFMRSTLRGTLPLPIVDDTTTYGLVIDTTACSPDDVAIAVAEVDAGSDLARRVRVEPGKQYRIRWHVVSPRRSDLQAQLRLRVRTLRFAWTQKLELGGAWAAGPLNNAMAQQLLPGVGTANPAKRGDEQPGVLDGGWYTMYFHAPNVIPLRQPGPGVARPSRRDLKCAVDVLDTLSTTDGSRQEGGLFIVDEIEVAEFPTAAD